MNIIKIIKVYLLLLFAILGRARSIGNSTYTYKEFSIKLSDDFVEKKYENIDMRLTNGNVVFTLMVDEKNYRKDETATDCLKKIILEAGISGEVREYSSENISFSYVEYEEKIGSNEYFRMLVIVKGDEKNYFCDFFCNSNNRKEYSSKLLEWSKTIKINQFDQLA